jgi:phospholipid-binding lipoprotein MlaA
MRILSALCLAVLVTGCATAPQTSARDPWEGFNRSVYQFNEKVDLVVVKPVAEVYQNITPQPVRTGVKNFFGNLSDVWSTVNSALQLKPAQTVDNLLRVLINSTLGLYGVLDIATEMQLERHTEDFGQTLGHWGVPSGPYLVLPIMGPSTLRDTASLSVDTQGNLVRQLEHVPTRNSLLFTSAVDKRARYLGAGERLDELALDKYIFVRDVYLQKRLSDVWDGDPPDAQLPPDANPSSKPE